MTILLMSLLSSSSSESDDESDSENEELVAEYFDHSRSGDFDRRYSLCLASDWVLMLQVGALEEKLGCLIVVLRKLAAVRSAGRMLAACVNANRAS